MNAFNAFYTLLGGLGLFFYGMKMMSDALQSMAGDVIRRIISSLTTNRVLAVIVGMLVTMIIQSSSVTTVMTVGLVNAGLMKLAQAVGVIFGANIGTTITGWIISIKIGKYGLLLVGLGIFPVLFAKNNNFKQAGGILFGIGMIFTGLEYMSSAFVPLKDNPTFHQIISYFSGDNYMSYFASVMTGCLLTMILQSSSAMLGVTIALASTGAIGFKTSSALVLGENIGTTVTAILASVGGNTNAKRAAAAHCIFNILGVLVVFSLFYPFTDIIDAIVPGDPAMVDPDGSRPYLASHIAAFHSAFNVTAVIIFLPFLHYLVKFVTKLIPETSKDKSEHHLVFLGDPKDNLPATSILQAHSEIKKFKEILQRMALLTKDYLMGEGDPAQYDKITSYENIADNIQKEVTVFLCLLMERPMTHTQSIETQSLVKLADEYESIADYLYRAANYKKRFKETFEFSDNLKKEFFDFYDQVWGLVELASIGLYDEKSHDMKKCIERAEQLRVWADDIRDRHLDRVSKGEYGAMNALTYSDMVVSLRKIRSHAQSVASGIESFLGRE